LFTINFIYANQLPYLFQHYLRSIKHMVKEQQQHQTEKSHQQHPHFGATAVSEEGQKLSTLDALERAVQLVGTSIQ
jgi:hypothetical protein